MKKNAELPDRFLIQTEVQFLRCDRRDVLFPSPFSGWRVVCLESTMRDDVTKIDIDYTRTLYIQNPFVIPPDVNGDFLIGYGGSKHLDKEV